VILVASWPTALVQVNGLARSLQAVGSDTSPAHSPAGSSGLILAMAVLRSRAGTACTATMVVRQPITERGRSPVPTRTQSRFVLYASACPVLGGGRRSDRTLSTRTGEPVRVLKITGLFLAPRRPLDC
jgi:hypothetical protein